MMAQYIRVLFLSWFIMAGMTLAIVVFAWIILASKYPNLKDLGAVKAIVSQISTNDPSEQFLNSEGGNILEEK